MTQVRQTSVPVVYKNMGSFNLKKKNFLAVGLPSWQPLGLLVGCWVIPFAPRNISWAEAAYEAYAYSHKMPTAEELFAVWTPEVAHEFDLCAKALGYPPINSTGAPIGEFPSDFANLREVDRASEAPFYHFGKIKTPPRMAPKPDTPNSHVGIGNRYSSNGLGAKPIYIRPVWRYKK